MFAVIWSPSASGDYSAIVLFHLDRSMEIENSGYDINDKLQTNPTSNGEHISEGLWRISSGPVVALYSMDGNVVYIDAVRWSD